MKKALIVFVMIKKYLVILFFLIGCTKTIVVYDEEAEDFKIQKGKEQEGAIVLEQGDNCQIVDYIFIVCGK